MNLLDVLEERSPPFKRFLAFALIGVIGTLDVLTGYEMAFSLFYVMPISMAGWLMGRQSGLLASLLSTLVWLLTDLSGHIYAGPLVPTWNTLVRLSFFSIAALLLSAMRNSVEREKLLARTDYLTGAVNLRFFLELLQKEVHRSLRYRHPFSLVYIDLDNFKTVNDQFGHVIGDEVLRTLVGYMTTHVRKTDVVARLGGDEFALLLPETAQKSAQVAISKLRYGLLEEMQQSKWPITFSIGVLTCSGTQVKADELVRMADELMYSVKYGGKNAIAYSTYAD